MAIDLFMSVLRSYMSVQTNEGGWVMVIFPLVMVILPKIALTFSMLHTFFSYKVILKSYLKSLAKKMSYRINTLPMKIISIKSDRICSIIF
jgi:hypothetical protein